VPVLTRLADPGLIPCCRVWLACVARTISGKRGVDREGLPQECARTASTKIVLIHLRHRSRLDNSTGWADDRSSPVISYGHKVPGPVDRVN
jgi:hypothetical protein